MRRGLRAEERFADRLQGVSRRDCSKTSCTEPAVATLTFVYADSTAVIGPLSREPEPHSYDLCAKHAASFTVPQGWEVVMAPTPLEPQDDVLAIARALMGPSRQGSEDGFERDAGSRDGTSGEHTVQGGTRIRHLKMMRSPRDD